MLLQDVIAYYLLLFPSRKYPPRGVTQGRKMLYNEDAELLYSIKGESHESYPGITKEKETK